MVQYKDVQRRAERERERATKTYPHTDTHTQTHTLGLYARSKASLFASVMRRLHGSHRSMVTIKNVSHLCTNEKVNHGNPPIPNETTTTHWLSYTMDAMPRTLMGHTDP